MRKNFLTKISYDTKINEKSDQFSVKNYKLSYRNQTLSFEYNINLNYKIYDKNILNIVSTLYNILILQHNHIIIT